MPICPSCGSRHEQQNGTCPRCGAPGGGEMPFARYRAELRDLSPLRELLPERGALARALPHPAGYVLGIGGGAVLALIVVHALLLPRAAQATAKKPAEASAAADRADASRLRHCIRTAEARARDRCDAATAPDATVRRALCRAALLTAAYTRCTAARTGRAARCLRDCVRKARACSAACSQGAATAPGKSSTSGTGLCISPCWTGRLGSCSRACFTQDPLPRQPSAL